MKTISAEQFKKLYGDQAYTETLQNPGFMSKIGNKVGDSFKSSLGYAKSGIDQVANPSGNPLNLFQGVGKAGAGVIGAIFSPLAPAVEPTIGKGLTFTADKIANNPTVQRFANTPAGKATAGLAEGVQNYSVIAGTVGGGLKTPKLASGVTDATRSVASKLTSGVTETASNAKTVAQGPITTLLSIFTGEKNPVVAAAMKNPTMADIGVQAGDAALRDVVQQAAQNSVKARANFSLAYNKAFQRLAGDNTNKLLSGKTVLYKFADDLKSSGIQIAKDGKLDFTKSLIKANPGEAGKIQAAYDALRVWNEWDLNGANHLKQLVGKLTKFPTEAGGSSKSAFLGRFYHYLDSNIEGKLPPKAAVLYRTMNDRFSKTISIYDDMVDLFNSGDPFKKVAQLFSDNSDQLRQLVSFYEQRTGKQVAPVVAGRTLALPKQAAFGFLNPRAWIDFFITPKVQGKVVTKVGKLLNR